MPRTAGLTVGAARCGSVGIPGLRVYGLLRDEAPAMTEALFHKERLVTAAAVLPVDLNVLVAI